MPQELSPPRLTSSIRRPGPRFNRPFGLSVNDVCPLVARRPRRFDPRREAWLSFAAVRSRHPIAAGLAALAVAAPACAGDEGADDGLATVRAGAPARRCFRRCSRARAARPSTSRRTAATPTPARAARPWRTVQRAFDTAAAGTAGARRRRDVRRGPRRRAGRHRRAPITVAGLPRASASSCGRPRRAATPTRSASPAAPRSSAYTGFVLENASGTSSTNVYFEGSAHDVELSAKRDPLLAGPGRLRRGSARDASTSIRNRIHDNGRGHESGQHQSHGIYIEGADHLVANNVIYAHPFGFGIQIYPAEQGHGRRAQHRRRQRRTAASSSAATTASRTSRSATTCSRSTAATASRWTATARPAGRRSTAT